MKRRSFLAALAGIPAIAAILAKPTKADGALGVTGTTLPEAMPDTELSRILKAIAEPRLGYRPPFAGMTSQPSAMHAVTFYRVTLEDRHGVRHSQHFSLADADKMGPGRRSQLGYSIAKTTADLADSIARHERAAYADWRVNRRRHGTITGITSGPEA